MPYRGVLGPHTSRLLGVLVAACVACACAPGDVQTIHDVTIVGPEGTATAIRLPARLDRLGLVPARASRYHVRADLRVDPQFTGDDLVVVLPSLSARARATANGEDLVALRSGSRTAYRQRPPLAWAVPARLTRGGTLALDFEVDHTWTQSAWLTAPPELVRAADGLGHGTWVGHINLPFAAAALAVLITITLVMLWRFLIDPAPTSRRLGGRLALQGLAATIYPLQVMGLLIPLGRFEVPLMCSGLIIAMISGLYYTHDFLNLPSPSRRWIFAVAVILAVCWVDNDPFRATDLGVRLMVAFMVVTLCVILATCVRVMLTRRDRESWLYLLAWLTLAVMTPPDFLAWGGVADVLHGARFGVLALTLFPLLIDLLLNQQSIRSIGQANALLAGRVQELEVNRSETEQLNTELRRQIADRAAQIHAALLLSRGSAGVAPTLAPGEVVQGRYRVERELGAGGMGTVYEVTRLVDGRRLALKLAREISADALARMAREAQTAATVTNPHVVAMLDVDIASAGFLFLVMEFVDGEPLSSQRERYGDRPWALEVLAQLADGLAAMHRVGVIHRDLKPANVLIARGDGSGLQVKISDFGISVPEGDSGGARSLAELFEPEDAGTPAAPRAAADDVVGPTVPSVSPRHGATPDKDATAATQASPILPLPRPEPGRGQPSPLGKRQSAGRPEGASPALTRTGHLPGTPAYMAPELAKGRDRLVLAADVFAFGVIARELLVGKRPFMEPAIRAMLEGRTPPKVASIVESWPEAPAHLASLFDACLALTPEARPTADELATVLARATSPGEAEVLATRHGTMD